jgi:hypothetical protein
MKRIPDGAGGGSVMNVMKAERPVASASAEERVG